MSKESNKVTGALTQHLVSSHRFLDNAKLSQPLVDEVVGKVFDHHQLVDASKIRNYSQWGTTHTHIHTHTHTYTYTHTHAYTYTYTHFTYTYTVRM